MSKARGLADLGNAYSDGALSNRNLIINGAMQVAQRGTSVTGQNGSGFIVDRFEQTLNSYGVWTREQVSDAPDGFSNSFKLTCTTPDTSPSFLDYSRVSYQFEGQDLQQLQFGSSAAKSFTVSFWVKSNVTATYVLWAYQLDSATNRQINKLFTIGSANTWEKKTITIEGDSSGQINNDNGSGLILGWVFSSGTGYTSGTRPENWAAHATADRWVGLTADVGGAANNYFQITGVQLEVGDTATPFEHRSYGDELARCQRYYYQDDTANHFLRSFYASATGDWYEDYPLPVVMRATPTWTSQLGGDVSKVNAVSTLGKTAKSGYVIFTVSSTGQGYCSLNTVTADAEL